MEFATELPLKGSEDWTVKWEFFFDGAKQFMIYGILCTHIGNTNDSCSFSVVFLLIFNTVIPKPLVFVIFWLCRFLCKFVVEFG